MPRLVYAIPCLQVIHDSETNLVNYINCIEQITVSALPVEFGEMVVGTNWVREVEGDRLHLRLRVEAPSGDTAAEKTTDPKAFETFERFRYNIRLPGFTIKEEGDYLVYIEAKYGDKWAKRATLPVRVTLAVDEPEGGPAEE